MLLEGSYMAALEMLVMDQLGWQDGKRSYEQVFHFKSNKLLLCITLKRTRQLPHQLCIEHVAGVHSPHHSG